MSYTDIFEAHANEMLKAYEESEANFFEVHLRELREEADRAISEKNRYLRSLNYEEGSQLSNVVDKLSDSVELLKASSSKTIAELQKRLKSASELLNNVTARTVGDANETQRSQLASLEEQLDDVRRRQASLQNEVDDVTRRQSDFRIAHERLSRQLETENAAELNACRASAEKELRKFRGEMALAVAERRRKVDSIEAEAKRHHSVHAACDKLLRHEERRFNRLETSAKRRLVTVQKTYEKLLREVENDQTEIGASEMSNA